MAVLTKSKGRPHGLTKDTFMMDEFIQIEKKKMTRQTTVTWYPGGDLRKAKVH